MHPDLSANLHTEECNILIKELLQCHADNPFKKYFGHCNSANTEVNRCLKREREQKRLENKKKTMEKRARMGLA